MLFALNYLNMLLRQFMSNLASLHESLWVIIWKKEYIKYSPADSVVAFQVLTPIITNSITNAL